MGLIRGYQTELRSVWDREEREKREKEERAARRREREWETWQQDIPGPTLAGGSGSNPSSPTGSAPPPYEDGLPPPEQQPAPQAAVPAIPARPPKEIEQPHQQRVRFEEILQEIPAPRHYTDDEYEYGPRDHHRRKERGRARGRDHRDDRHHERPREYEYAYDYPQSPRSASRETQFHRHHDRQQHPDDIRRDHRADRHDRHHHRHHHDDHHPPRRERDDRLTDWNIPSPNIPSPNTPPSIPAPSTHHTHWDAQAHTHAHLRSPRSPHSPHWSPRSAPLDFEAVERHRARTEHRPRRRHSVSYAPSSHANVHWSPAVALGSDVDRELREGDNKYPRGFRVVRFAL